MVGVCKGYIGGEVSEEIMWKILRDNAETENIARILREHSQNVQKVPTEYRERMQGEYIERVKRE